MLLDKLTISPFRGVGIGEPLSLNLTAGLTLIYAPNGTGKTTICDAIEWLFTGDVARFSELPKRKAQLDFRNVFAPSTPPYVHAAFAAPFVWTEVRRAGEKATVEVLENHYWTAVTVESLLSKLTPEALPVGSRGIQSAQLRRGWLRAARFLEPESLALLLDSGTSTEQRDIAFSELLGVGDLRRQERDLSKILKELPSDNQLNREIANAKEQSAALQQQISAVTARLAQPHTDVFALATESARKLLALNTLGSPDSSPEAKLAELEANLSVAEATAAHVRARLELLRAESVTLGAQTSQRESLMDLAAQTTLRMTTASENIKKQQVILDRSEKSMSEMQARLARLQQWPFNRLLPSVDVGIESWSSAKGDTSDIINAQSIEREIVTQRATIDRYVEVLRTVQRCEVSFPSWQASRAREAEDRARLKSLEERNVDGRHEEAELARLQGEQNLLRQRYDNLSSPLQSLRRLGEDIINKMPEESACPLCAHDHSSHAALHDAVAAALEALPSGLLQIRQRLEALQAEIDSMISAQAAKAAVQRSQELLRANIAQLQHEIAAIETPLQTIGFSSSDLDKPNFGELLLTTRRNLEKELDEAREHINQLNAKRGAIELLMEVNDLADRTIFYLSQLAVPVQRFNLQSEPLSRWRVNVASLYQAGLAEISRVEAQIKDASVAIEDARASLESETRILSAINASSQEISRSLADIERRRADFENRWTEISEGDTWAEEAYFRALERNKAATMRLQQARQEIAQAKASHAAAVEASEQQRSTAALHARVKEIEGQLRKTTRLTGIRNELKEGIQKINATAETHIATQIQPLVDVISALYVRVQGNAFIDRIAADLESGSLRWLPSIANFRLSDTAEMSLGQRQDLALSIFLARAREIGGTFVLDEPLLHLDDLNRVALLDVLRTIVTEGGKRIRLVITTANMSLLRHIREKFGRVTTGEENAALRMYRLHGEPRSGIHAEEIA